MIGPTSPRPRNRWLRLSLLTFIPLVGCTPYRFGAATLFPPDVTSIYIPIFQHDGFSPDLAERLTEAVQKEVQLRTNYRLVGTAQADSILVGTILQDTRRVLVENFSDEPRELEVNLQVQIRWLDRRRLPIREANVPVPIELVAIGQSASLIAEAGESQVVAEQEAIDRLARQIVSSMEQPW